MGSNLSNGQKTAHMKPCALIPAYNEESTITEVVAGAGRYLQRVIVVDDGSSDATAERAREAGAEVVRHEENLGKGAALKSGLARAFDEGFDPVIILDADGQHDWREIPRFLDAARDGQADMVVGDRMRDTEDMPLVRYLTNKVTSFFVSKLAGQRVPDSQCGFRLVNERAFRSMGFGTSRYDTESEMLIEAGRAGCTIASVPVSTIYGREKSRINPLVDTIRFIRLILRHIFKRSSPKGVGHP
jgi:glycosyltransferase involved in cell wall biosynthesis